MSKTNVGTYNQQRTIRNALRRFVSAPSHTNNNDSDMARVVGDRVFGALKDGAFRFPEGITITRKEPNSN